MALGGEVKGFLSGLVLFDMTLNQFLFRVLFAVIFIIVGVIIGKILGKGIKKLLDQIKVKERAGISFFNLIIWVVKLSIYILFINIALSQLNIPALTKWLTSVLIIIPAFVGALILIGFGFAVAVYLRSVVEDSDVVGWKVLSMFLFYFVIFVSSIYALKTAFVSLDTQVSNTIIIILTAIIGAAVAYYHTKQGNGEEKTYYRELKVRR